MNTDYCRWAGLLRHLGEAAPPRHSLQFLACGLEQDFIHIHVRRLVHGKGDGLHERTGRNCGVWQATSFSFDGAVFQITSR